MNAQEKNEEWKRHREAIYKWRKEHPEKYHETAKKSSLAYYYKNRDEISERRRNARIAKKAESVSVI
jgi:hypothetical protein